MKTPKEYAEELYIKYLILTGDKFSAKKCALIAVQMLMAEIILLNSGAIYKQFDRERFDYFSEVKQEIEKL